MEILKSSVILICFYMLLKLGPSGVITFMALTLAFILPGKIF